MSDQYVTDPALLQQLNGGESEYVTDPALLSQLNGPAQVGPVSPYMGYPTGAGVSVPASVSQGYQTAKTIAQPTTSAVGDILGTYLKNPAAAFTDVTMGHLGLPPPVAGTKLAPGVEASYQNIKDWVNKTGQFAPKVNPGQQAFGNMVNQLTAPTTNEVAQGAKLAANMTPEELVAHTQSGQSMDQLAAKQAAAKAEQIAATQGPSAVEGSQFIKNITQKFAPMAEAVAPVLSKAAPVLNTVGRIAGPAGMALNAYEAGKFAHESKLGQRLSEGEGRLAQTAFRNMNTPYGATLTRDQARAVLQSGNQRDIQAFGGPQRLQQLAQ